MIDDPALALNYTHVFDIRINFDKRWTWGPVSGGAHHGYTSVGAGSTVSGPRLQGRVVDYSGADWPVIRPDGVIELNAHYMIETDDGARIYIRNMGYVHGRLSAEIGPYFRCTPQFRAPEGAHGWLNRTVIVGVGKRVPKVEPQDAPDHSLFRYYAIL
jgi:Protein of unknown function (DUF3237)